MNLLKKTFAVLGVFALLFAFASPVLAYEVTESGSNTELINVDASTEDVDVVLDEAGDYDSITEITSVTYDPDSNKSIHLVAGEDYSFDNDDTVTIFENFHIDGTEDTEFVYEYENYDDAGVIITSLRDVANDMIGTGVDAFTEILLVALPFIIAMGVFFMVYRMVIGRLS